MKDIRRNIVDLLQTGYCTPQISQLAKKLKEPASTIHYNITRLKEERAVLTCKAVLDPRKTGGSFCAYLLINLGGKGYDDPEACALTLSKWSEVESVDICTGDWELIIKVHVADQDAFYTLVKRILAVPGIERTKTLVSMKQIKREFITTI